MKKPTILERLKKIEDALFNRKPGGEWVGEFMSPPLFEYHTEQGVKKVYAADHAPAQAKAYADHAEHWFNKFQEASRQIGILQARIRVIDLAQRDKAALTDALAYQSIRVKDLKRALEVYGVHYYGCSWHSRGIFSSPKPRVCDCGLKKAVNS